MVNYQRAPALGVGPNLRLSWAVPPSPSRASNGVTMRVQTSYQLRFTDAVTGSVVWDSGVVNSNASVNVHVDGLKVGLRAGAAYDWTVSCDGSTESAPARFVTSLWDGFDPSARWIWAADTNKSQYFAHMRHVLSPTMFRLHDDAQETKVVATALMFVTAWLEPTMLSAYKVYVDGILVSIGPGRGEANVMARNSTFLHAPYTTVDVTEHVQSGSVLAVEGMAPLFQTPCDLHACHDYNTAGGGVLLQLVITFTDGTSETVVTGGTE